ncbi:MAG: glycosyltransferase family 2 protein [Elusimicrobia bacterium]|nr:glycosyltransferase family 2 protein [Elusimicrobiota bacterium]
MKTISIITPCYNEERNVAELYKEVKSVMSGIKGYEYEHIFIDNASTDNTVSILKEIAGKDRNVKLIVNLKNYGHLKSPFYAILQAKGDAVISVVADMQDPPALIRSFIEKWEAGYKIVVGVKNESKEARWMFFVRKLYYWLISVISTSEQIKNFTGFGLYDRSVIEILRQFDERYPYFRGLISDLGFPVARVEFIQPRRKKGRSNNNLYTLFDLAMLGIVNYSVLPLRLATFIGLITAALSFFTALFYLIYKIIFWNKFQVGMAPLVIGIFFFSAVQLFFIGIIGEYIGAIYTQIKKRPLVIEKERINF